MKKTLIALSLTAMAFPAAASDYFNGRNTAVSGAAVVTGNYRDSLLLNPSMGANYGPNDDFAMAGNFGVMATDRDDLIDALEELEDYIDFLDNRPNDDLTEPQGEELKSRLRAVDNKTVFVGMGANGLIAIPNRFASAALVARTRANISATPDIDETDFDVIDAAVEQDTSFRTDDLFSEVNARGTIITEVGINLARAFMETEDSRLLVGVMPKRMYVESIVYTAQVADFDSDDLDANDYTRSDSMMNLDVGVTYQMGDLSYGFVMRDMVSKSFSTRSIHGERVEIKTQSTAAVGYDRGWFSAEVAMDLNAVPNFALQGDTQMLRAGFTFDAWRWAQLRAGFQRDLSDTLEDTYSIGLGLSPFNVINLDIAGLVGDNNTYGGSVQLGLRF
ncbi:conjugal transfer protein TraF [Marinimicrobium alkaliphilum]|uniref:conjugal transfer protein TraF n=1 Tax=Marinimicrobium alkaliphilum TaxID=2202654 RepID=UPI000DBA318C|nr:conjugal transfer protein TraF [Marinimicrobium alkaliphilum]